MMVSSSADCALGSEMTVVKFFSPTKAWPGISKS